MLKLDIIFTNRGMDIGYDPHSLNQGEVDMLYGHMYFVHIRVSHPFREK